MYPLKIALIRAAMVAMAMLAAFALVLVLTGRPPGAYGMVLQVPVYFAAHGAALRLSRVLMAYRGPL